MSIVSRALTGLSLVLATGLFANATGNAVQAPAKQVAQYAEAVRNQGYMINMVFPGLVCVYNNDQFKALKPVLKDYMNGFFKNMMNTMAADKEFKKIKADPQSSPAVIKAAYDALVQQQVMTELHDHQFMLRLEKLLTPEQAKKFRDLAPKIQAYLREITRHDLVFWRMNAQCALGVHLYSDEQFAKVMSHLEELNATQMGPIKERQLATRAAYQEICKPGADLAKVEAAYQARELADFDFDMVRRERDRVYLLSSLTEEQHKQLATFKANDSKFFLALVNAGDPGEGPSDGPNPPADNTPKPGDKPGGGKPGIAERPGRPAFEKTNNLLGNRARVMSLAFTDDQFKKVSEIATKYQDELILLKDALQTEEDKYDAGFMDPKQTKDTLKPLFEKVLKAGFAVEQLNLKTEAEMRALLGDKAEEVDRNTMKVMIYERTYNAHKCTYDPGSVGDPGPELEVIFTPSALNALVFKVEELGKVYDVLLRANATLAPNTFVMKRYQERFDQMILDPAVDQFELADTLVELRNRQYEFHMTVEQRNFTLEKMKPAGHNDTLKKMAQRINDYMRLFS